jgi:hypothetical protein
MLLSTNIATYATKQDFILDWMKRLDGQTLEDQQYFGKFYDYLKGVEKHEEVLKCYIRTSFYKNPRLKKRDTLA